MKNKKVLLSCILTLLPIIIFILLIYLVALFNAKNYNQTNMNLTLIIVTIVCVILGIISISVNIKLENKVIRIIFLAISIILVIVGITLVISGINAYKTSKKYDKIISNYVKKIKQETYYNLDISNYKNGDLISSNKYEFLGNTLGNNSLYCNWYAELVDINNKDIKVHIGCWSISDNDSYYYKSKNFDNKILEKLK